MRLAWSVVVVACGGADAPRPIEPSKAPPVAPVAPIDAAAAPEPTVDAAPIELEPPRPHFGGSGKGEATWDGPVPPIPTAVPMAPGIHPILVTTSALEDAATFFVLGCAKVEKGKPTKFLDGKACAPLLQNVQLELVLEKSRVPVKIVGKGTALDCPWVGAHRQPTVKVAGIPKTADHAESGDIVSKGMVHYAGPVDAETLKAIRKVAPLTPTKRPNDYGPHPSGQYDLDGDGKLEVMMSMGGTWILLFDAGGTEIGRLGCYLG